jgi:hypothetical protein
MRPATVVKALASCEEATLTQRVATGNIRIRGWDETWRTIRDESRDRMRKLRAKADEIINVGDGAVTGSDGVTALDQSRVEKSRSTPAPNGAGVLVAVTPTPRFDFAAIYARYPRKVGKTNGLKRLTASVKSEADYASLVRALTAYIAHVAGKDQQYIRQFDTWCTTWRDWLEVAPPRSVNTSAHEALRRMQDEQESRERAELEARAKEASCP